MNETDSKPHHSWLVRLLNPKVAIPIVILVSLAVTPVIYRNLQLSLVPNPGDPFDIKAFIKSTEVKSADNAMIDFGNALSLLTSRSSDYDWPQLSDELLDDEELSTSAKSSLKFLGENEPALLEWIKGTKKPDYSELPLATANFYSTLSFTQESRTVIKMFLAKALHEWKKGNHEKSAQMHLACFHTSRLIQRNGSAIHRMVAISIYRTSAQILVRQLQDENIPPEVIEKLLQELIKINDATTPLSNHVKFDYVLALQSEDILLMEGLGLPSSLSTPSVRSWAGYLQGEPDLFFNLLAQETGNQLTQIDRPRYLRSRYGSSSSSPLLYNLDPKLPLKKKQLTPAQIDAAWSKSALTKNFGAVSSYKMVDADDYYCMTQQLLVAALKLEIYRRQHRKYPLKLKEVYPNETIPADLFDPKGNPVEYARDSDNACRIWSVGIDAVDNNGESLELKTDDADFGFQLGTEIEK